MPLGLFAVASLENCFSHVKVRSFRYAVCARIVSGNANMVDMISLAYIAEGLDEGGTIIRDDFAEGAPAAEDVFENPIAYGLGGFGVKHAVLRIVGK